MPERTAPLWLAAVFLAAALAPGAQARDLAGASRSGDTSLRLAQAQTTHPAEPQAGPEQEQPRAEMLARELAAARRELMSLLTLLTKARDETAQARREAERETAELRKALQEERDRASPEREQPRAEMPARELAAARRDLMALLTLLTKARDETAQARREAERETAELRKALQEERDRARQPGLEAVESAEALRGSMLRDRAERMERDLATMRRGNEPTAAPAAMTGEQAPDSSVAELRKSLEQEREHTARLEQDLAAARGDVEKQTALAAKAGEETGQMKPTADSSTAELLKSLEQEREHAALLEQDLAAARRDVETQKALVAQAGTEVSQLKKTADAGSAELRKSLEQERDRASRLEQDVAAARRDVETQVAFAAKASDEATKFKQAADKGSAELRQSLQKEQEKAGTQAQELATARARIYAFEAQARQAGDQAAGLKQTAEGGVADLRTSLQQERDRASRLEQDVAAARRDVEKQTALAAKAGEEAGQMKQAADSNVAELQKSLKQEQERAARFEQDLAAARRDVERQASLLSKASGEASQTKRTAAELRKSLERERDRASRLEQDVAAARRDVEKQTALAAKAGEEAGQMKQAADSSVAELQKSLKQEQERAARLEQDVAAARRDVETQTALAAKAGKEASQMNQAADSSTAEMQKSLEQEPEHAARLEQDAAAARRDVEKQTAPAAKAGRQASQTKRTAKSRAAGMFNSPSNSIWTLIFAPPRR